MKINSHHRISFIVTVFAVTMAATLGLLDALATRAWFPVPPATDVSGTISTNTTWTLAGSPYVLTDTLTVGTGVTLTIEPGVVVMGQSSTGLVVNGHLQAIGTEPQPITFTSAANTGAGEWYGLDFDGGTGYLEHTVVRYAGQYGSDGIFIAGQPMDGPVTITNSMIANNLGYPISVFTDDLHRLQLSNVSASGNVTDRVQIYATDWNDNKLVQDTRLTAVPGMEGYEFSNNDLVVPEGITLTLDPGVVLMGSAGLLDVSGRLEAVGTVTNPITLTSAANTGAGEWYGVYFSGGESRLKHVVVRYGGKYSAPSIVVDALPTGRPISITDSVIQDNLGYPISVATDNLHRLQLSNVSASGNMTDRVQIYATDWNDNKLVQDTRLTAVPGLEGYEFSNNDLVVPEGITLTLDPGVVLMGSAGLLDVSGRLEAVGTVTNPITLTSAANTGAGEWYGVYFSGGESRLKHVVVRYGGKYSAPSIVVDALPTGRPISITDSVIQDNLGYPISVATDNLHRLQLSNVSASGNMTDRVQIYATDWNDNKLVQDTRLTAVPGMEGYEFSNNDLVVPEGITLTLDPGVVLMGSAGLLDVSGRLEAVGTVTNPITLTSAANTGAGEWYGVYFSGGESRLKHVVVRYGGKYSAPSIVVDALPTGRPISITDSVIQDNLGYPISVATDNLHRLQLSNVSASGNVTDRVQIYATDWNDNKLVQDTRLTAVPGLEGYEFSNNDLVVPEGITLTLDPGVVLMGSSGLLDVSGRLEAVGTVTNPITLTSAANTGAGEWYGVYFSGGESRLKHVVVRYGGKYSAPSIVVDALPTGRPISITDSVIQDNLGYPISVATDNLHRLQLSNVSASGNMTDRVQIYATDWNDNKLVQDTRLTAVPGLEGYEITSYGLEIPTGITLTLDPGVTIMASGAGYCSIMVNGQGHLEAVGTAVSPVTFTSTSDSGSGEWTGICVVGSAHLDYTHFRNGELNVDIWGATGGPVLIENSVISDSAHYGMSVYADALHRLQMSNVTFSGANRHILIDNYNNSLVADATLSNQTGLEGYEVGTLNFPTALPKLIVPTGITLTMEAGTTLKSVEYGEVVVSGHLEAVGTASDPVTFTSITDTAPGEWYGLIVSGTADLQYTHIRNGQDNLTLQGSGDAQLIKSELSQAGVNGLNVYDGRITAVCSTFNANANNAVYVNGSGAPDVTLFSSNISGNGNGVNNANGSSVEARYNWWGDASGPGGDGPGSGDIVLGNVLYDPWLAEPACLLFDLEVTQSAAADPVLAGETLTYTAVITNHGVAAATAVSLTLNHSANAAFLGSSLGNCTGATAVQCAVGVIPAGASTAVTYYLQIDPAATGIITSAISITAAESELILSNNATVVETAVAPLPSVGFSQTNYSVYEDALTAMLTVTLDVAPVFTVTVDYAGVGGTAVSGTDYTLTPGTLTFLPGITTQTIVISIIDDHTLDGQRSLDLQLTQQTKAALAQSSASLIILDDEMRYQQFLPFLVR